MKFRHTDIICTLLAALWVSFIWTVSAHAQLASFTLTPEAETTLKQGGIFTKVWRDKSRDDAAIDVIGVVDIAATPAIIWELMLDCNRGMDIVKDMSSCEILEASPDSQWDIRKQVFKVGFPLPKVTTHFRSDYVRHEEIKISRIGGDMKVQDGLWTLTPLSLSKTRVTYRAAVLPKFPIPRGLLKRVTRKDTPKILKNLRSAAIRDMSQTP